MMAARGTGGEKRFGYTGPFSRNNFWSALCLIHNLITPTDSVNELNDCAGRCQATVPGKLHCALLLIRSSS